MSSTAKSNCAKIFAELPKLCGQLIEGILYNLEVQSLVVSSKGEKR
jgi:hypothetical protein